MDDPAASLDQALALLGQLGREVPAHDAVTELDDATLQVFWREWPRVSGWAGTLWRLLDADLALAAKSPADPDLDEIGGSG
jgi:hypothetical protein